MLGTYWYVNTSIVFSRNVEGEREASLFEVIRHADIKATEDKDPKEGKIQHKSLTLIFGKSHEENNRSYSYIISGATNGHADGELDEDDDVVMVENGGDNDLPPSRKRKSEVVDGVPDKKVKTQ